MTIIFENQKQVQYTTEHQFDDVLLRESRKAHNSQVLNEIEAFYGGSFTEW